MKVQPCRNRQLWIWDYMQQRGCYTYIIFCYNVGAYCILMKQNSRISSAWTRELLTSPWSWRRWNHISTLKIRNCVWDSSAGETSRKLTYILATEESFKSIHSFGLPFVYPKCTAPHVDKHEIKETPLVGQTY